MDASAAQFAPDVPEPIDPLLDIATQSELPDNVILFPGLIPDDLKDIGTQENLDTALETTSQDITDTLTPATPAVETGSESEDDSISDLFDTDKLKKLAAKEAFKPKNQEMAMSWIQNHAYKKALKLRKKAVDGEKSIGEAYKLWKELSAEEQTAYANNGISGLSKFLVDSALGASGLAGKAVEWTYDGAKAVKRGLTPDKHKEIENWNRNKVKDWIISGAFTCKNPDIPNIIAQDEKYQHKMAAMTMGGIGTIFPPLKVLTTPGASLEGVKIKWLDKMGTVRANVQNAVPDKS
jgi:hypothetical protein